MILFKILLFILSYLGIIGLLSHILYKHLWANLYNCLKRNNAEDTTLILFLSVCWFSCLGLVGVISSIFFYLDISNYISRIFIFMIGIFGLIYVFFQSGNLKLLFSNIEQGKNNKLLLKEKYLLAITFLIFLIYIYKSTVPWFDNDEITQYGYYTKLAYDGWTISDDVFGLFTRFSEVAYSFYYSITESNLLPKIIRSIGIMFNSLTIYCVCRFLLATRFIALLGSVVFLVTPELAYIGTSMKTDVVLMGFELTGLLLFSLGICSISFKAINKINIPKYVPKIFLFSIIFCMLGMASRNSGLYSLILVSIVGLPIILIKLESIFIKLKYLIIILTSGTLIFSGIVYNIVSYLNPFYPLGGPWMLLFPGGEYDSSWNLKGGLYADAYNINIGIPIINDFYIIIYHALGFEDPKWQFLNLPSRPDPAATGWLNPVLLIVFLAPFYFKSKDILLIFFSFVVLYLFWSNGLQYSRIFVAASSLSILIVIKIIALNHTGLILGGIRIFIIFLLNILVIVFFYYQIQWARYQNPYGLSIISSDETIYESNSRRSFDASEWHLYDDNEKERLLGKEKLEKHLSFNDFTKIKEIISLTDQRLIVFNMIDKIKYMHILFSKGYYINLEIVDKNLVLDYIEKVPLEKNVLCIIKNNKDNIFIDTNFSEILYSSDKIKFLCSN
ncbi:MAG: hypothetical protein CMI95_03630 [Pelagibacteraceae bacterium]|nr:hypothetical protein [Pelagibacteraceae bacterium]